MDPVGADAGVVGATPAVGVKGAAGVVVLGVVAGVVLGVLGVLLGVLLGVVVGVVELVELVVAAAVVPLLCK